MSTYGIQGHQLEVTVVGCNKLTDTEWISRQDPYVCLEYGNTKFRTRTCTDGGKNPTFQEKFFFTLIEGLRELNVVVWNSNTITQDAHIGDGKVQFHKVLSQGFDDAGWPLQSRTGRYTGEVRLILHYPNANKSATTYTLSAPPVTATSPYPPSTAYPTPSPYPSCPPNLVVYPPSPYAAPPQPAVYPPSPYAPPQPATAYPPQPYPHAAYTPQPYPPPPQAHCYPPGPHPGIYPPQPY